MAKQERKPARFLLYTITLWKQRRLTSKGHFISGIA
jgi:hypothetical protein